MSTEKCHISCPGDPKPQHVAVHRQDAGLGPVELEVHALAAGGRGIGRHEGLVWFVPGALPGDRVLAEPGRRHPRFVEGRLVRILQPSEQRREPPCAVQHQCGGCPWMALEPVEQRRWKHRMVGEALRRIGGSPVAVEPLRTPSRDLAYRNKIELTLGSDPDGRPVVGMHGRGTGLVDVARCEVQHEAANSLLADARELLLDRAGDWCDGKSTWRLMLRRSAHAGELLAGVWETDRPFPLADELAERLRLRHADLVGFVRIRSRPGHRGGSRATVVWGRGWLDEQLGGFRFRLPASCFFQVHAEMAAVVTDVVAECAGDVRNQKLLDLYGGVGVHGLELARRGAHVTVCEADDQAVACGRRAARAHDADVRYVHATVETFLRAVPDADDPVGVIVANPPRSGLGRGATRGILARQPQRIVVVSCDPATLARDAGRLVGAGYRLDRAVPIDMFPQTAHIETVAAFSRVCPP